MKIKSKRNFIAGILCAILSIVSLAFYIISRENRIIVSCFLLLVMAIFNFKATFSKNGIFEKIREYSDERDQYLTLKTSLLLIGFMNYLLTASIFVFAIAYGIWKSFFLIVIMYTLGGILVFMFFGYLLINSYVDKHE